MKGIIGAERAKTFTASSYGDGDNGGSAGGYGVHGMMDDDDADPPKMASAGYGGAAIAFEGGIRGGAVSEPETMPSQAVFPKKKGYDEHRSHGYSAEGTIHGLPGVEGIKPPTQAPGDHGMSDAAAGDTEMTGGGDGYGCPHGCGASMKSAHGLARHVHSKHGGFGGLGHAFRGKHGSGYTPGHKDDGPTGESSVGEFRGETEGPKAMEAVAKEWSAAKSEIGKPAASVHSSYGSGDGGGSYGKMKGLTSGR